MQNDENIVSGTDQRPELVFALVGAIGTDQTKVTDQLMASLSRYGYETAEPIHLIEAVHDFPRWESRDKYPETPYDLRAESHMTMGDEFRETCDDSSALALLGINYIRGKIRLGIDPEGEGRRPLPSHAYVFRSLKHQDEVNLLRRIYQPNLFVIGTYTYREQRISRLSERIAGSHQSARPGEFRAQAEQLNTRDQVEIGKKHGQNVEKTFPLADIFIDCSNESTSQESIDRLIDLIFGHPYRTPSRDEFAMFHAQGAALRSSDMSRQVGAVIAGDEGEVVAMGTNEVPKTGGGQYWEDDEDDYRDHKVGYESNTKLRHTLLAELIG